MNSTELNKQIFNAGRMFPTPVIQFLRNNPKTFAQMPSNYRKTVPYQWYLGGDAEGLRQHAMPAFHTDNQGRIVLGAGELFCRVSIDGGATLYMDRHKFSSLGALKKHIRTAHEIEVAESHSGGLTARDDQLTAKYWMDIYNLSNGTTAKPAPPRKAKAVVKDNALPRPSSETTA
ncbi:hypothetical protein F4782DRAFT_57231 [Xylaria castorea]|nr:hypothetical protein F4782DRAFT_57231 [Xylaria castorea]